MARGLHRVAVAGGLWLVLATGAAAQAPAGEPGRPSPADGAAAAQAATPPAAPSAASPAPTSPAAGPTGPAGTESPASGRLESERLADYLESRRDARGRRCDLNEVAVVDALRYLACGAAGVWVVKVDAAGFAILDQRDVAGVVVGFFTSGDRLWARITRFEAQAVAELGASHVVEPPPAPTYRALRRRSARVTSRTLRPQVTAPAATSDERPPAHGKVLTTDRGYAVIDLGRDDGLWPGSRVAFFLGATGPSGGHVVVGEVESAGLDSSRVWVGVNEEVPDGTRVAATAERATASSLAPRRVGEVWEVEVLARPFLVLEDLGAGLFVDARVGYRGRSNYHIEALLQPFALATAGAGGIKPAAGIVTASYDDRLFEVGLGVGAQTVKDTNFGFEPGSGLTLAQRARLGARDGLHLEAFTYVVLFHSEFELTDVRVIAQIPLGGTTWLRVAGGGGSLGLGFGELGLRVLLSGNGTRDSLFLTTVVGGVNVFEASSCTDFGCEQGIDYAGPTVGVGLEWRL